MLLKFAVDLLQILSTQSRNWFTVNFEMLIYLLYVWYFFMVFVLRSYEVTNCKKKKKICFMWKSFFFYVCRIWIKGFQNFYFLFPCDDCICEICVLCGWCSECKLRHLLVLNVIKKNYLGTEQEVNSCRNISVYFWWNLWESNVV